MHSGRTQNKLLFYFLILITSFFVAVWSLPRYFSEFGKTLPGGGDIYLETWIINQHVQKIPLNLFKIFQGNIFYPYKNVMAFSEMFFPQALLAYLPVKVTGLPAAAYAFNLIFGQISLFFVCFFWFYEISEEKLTSMVATIALILSQIHFNFIGYLQIWVSTWWLISCWMLWKFITYKKNKYLVASSVFAAIQIWDSFLPIFFIFFFGLTLIFFHKKSFENLKSKYLILSIVLFSAITYPLISTYLRVSNEYSIVRSIRDAAHFSRNLNDIWGFLLSPGLYSLPVVAITVLLVQKNNKNKNIFWPAMMMLFSLLMSLGPVLKINGSTFKIFEKIFIPLPYGIFYYIIPGFKALRTPLRWIWPFAVFSAIFFVAVFAEYKSKYKNAILLGCLALALIGGAKANYWISVPSPVDYPEVYKKIKTLPGDVVIELPMYNWGVGEPYNHEFEREFYDIYHQKKLVNGASGFNPPDWEKTQALFWNYFPNQETDEKLKSIGVDYAIVHKNEYEATRLQTIYDWGKDRVLWQDERDIIFKLN